MEIIQLRCPNCGAEVDIENGIDMFYCKYCGTKIMVNGQDKETMKTKRRLKMMDKYAELRQQRYEQEEIEHQRYLEEREYQRKQENKIGIIIGVALILSLLLVYLTSHGII